MKYLKGKGKWTTSSKTLLIMAIISLIGIVMRWEYVKREALRGFGHFKRQQDTTSSAKPRE